VKFLVVTFGTEGDTRPLAALCRALMDAGHETQLLANAATLGSASALGVPNAPLAGDIRGITTAKPLAQLANSNAEAWMRATVAAGQGCDAIIVSALAAFIGLSAAEYLKVPAMGASLIPITPTAAFPSPFLPGKWLPGFCNRPSHRLVNEMIWRSLREKTNSARAHFAMAPRKTLWTTHPMLYGISPSLLPKPVDWPTNNHLCGQWVRPVRAWSAPPALRDFLAAGEPPIYIGFGSMAGFDTNTLLDAIVTAVGGRRALFYPGWGGTRGRELPANFCVIEDTPHDWLFPRTALAIHHGGSGTSHSAARAGIPSIVLPFAGDQPFWAERLRRLGIAPEATSGHHISAHVLKRAIDAAGTTQMRDRAAAVGEKMRAEDGLAAVVAAIEAEFK
jgi:UDP:flavonoid glycosyltransferase YjiC (YdhE family)